MKIFKSLQKLLRLDPATSFSHIAILITVSIILVCFSDYTYTYIAFLLVGLVQLLSVLKSYINTTKYQCQCDLKIISDDVVTATLHNKAMILSSVFVIMLSVVMIFILLMRGNMSEIISAIVTIDPKYKSMYMSNSDGVIALIKFIVIYLVIEKVHSCSLVNTIFMRCGTTLSVFTIAASEIVGDVSFPQVYINDQLINESRYSVSIYSELIEVVLDPPITLGYDDRIQYTLISSNNKLINSVPTCSFHDSIKCHYKCRELVSKITLPNSEII